MPGRGLGIGTIRPELRQHACEIATFDHIGRVREASDGVNGMASSVVERKIAIAVITQEIETVIARGPWRNIEGDAVVRAQLAVRRDHRYHLLDKLRMG